jgi:hypothetical protein
VVARTDATVGQALASPSGPLAFRATCDSAAALAARRFPSASVRLVADTVYQPGAGYEPYRGCAVTVAGARASEAANADVFRSGFPGGTWQPHEFEGDSARSAYAVIGPIAFCEVEVRSPQPLDQSYRTKAGEPLAFEIFCYSD